MIMVEDDRPLATRLKHARLMANEVMPKFRQHVLARAAE